MEHALSNKTKTALILLSLAAAFFVGVFVRHWLW
jgi:hypothetical protein